MGKFYLYLIITIVLWGSLFLTSSRNVTGKELATCLLD